MRTRITLLAWMVCSVILLVWTPYDSSVLAAPDSDGDGTPDVDCATNPNDSRCSIELPLRWCALQGSLANFAGGVMILLFILFLRPSRDSLQTPPASPCGVATSGPATGSTYRRPG